MLRSRLSAILNPHASSIQRSCENWKRCSSKPRRRKIAIFLSGMSNKCDLPTIIRVNVVSGKSRGVSVNILKSFRAQQEAIRDAKARSRSNAPRTGRHANHRASAHLQKVSWLKLMPRLA